MFFREYKDNITFYKHKFELGEIFTHGGLRSYIINKKYLIPWTVSSIGNSNSIVLKKLYSEYFERILIGFQLGLDNYIDLLYLTTGQFERMMRKQISYGYSDVFGIIDTTGSASGTSNSFDIVKKAVYELLEKNELLLLWYGFLGEEYIFSKYEYDSMLKYFNDLSYITDEIKVFFSSNLSNAICCSVFLFRKKQLTGSGISLRLNSTEALNSAIQEAKNITVVYKNKSYGHYKNLTKYEHLNIYNHICRISKKNYRLDFDNTSEELYLKDWLKNDIRLAYLNFCPVSSAKTIKVYSEHLYNCLPNIRNIEMKNDIDRI